MVNVEEVVGIQLPLEDETQIWDNENDKREVALYLQTTKGKTVSGTEHTPFGLPHRWTFETLKSCIQDFVSRVVANGDRDAFVLNQLYYKKKGKSKALVALNSDHDIPTMLEEYPLTWPGSGKRRKYLESSFVFS